MRRLLVISAVIFSLMASPCYAIEYCKDFLESGNPGGWSGSLKTWDDEWSLTVGEAVELDIWINDVPLPLLSGGFWIEYDPSKVSIVSVAAYDGSDIPGPWEVAFTVKVLDPGGPGTYLVSVSPPLMPATPDGDGDIIIAKVRFRCESEGDANITISTIPGLDTFVGDTTVFDGDIVDNILVIHQEIDICEGDFDNDGDQDGTDAALFKTDFGRSPFNRPCPPVSTTTTIPSGCPYEMVDCETKCVDPMTDEDFCGVDSSCLGGVICGASEKCILGVCEDVGGGSVYPAPVEKTGQTTSYATGDDGDLEKGVAWPNPRFTDNSDGTVTDNLTGLIWLKNANCYGARTWDNALSDSNGLADGSCELTDGSSSGEWRLPNRRELLTILHDGYLGPSLSDTVGTGQWSEGDPFFNVQPDKYWSSTTYPLSGGPVYAQFVDVDDGFLSSTNKSNALYVWPVRDPL